MSRAFTTALGAMIFASAQTPIHQMCLVPPLQIDSLVLRMVVCLMSPANRASTKVVSWLANQHSRDRDNRRMPVISCSQRMRGHRMLLVRQDGDLRSILHPWGLQVDDGRDEMHGERALWSEIEVQIDIYLSDWHAGHSMCEEQTIRATCRQHGQQHCLARPTRCHWLDEAHMCTSIGYESL